ncbi:substrate-binding periplasmic protein [Acanthopleuribacter pedis]|uniref:Transporter substrate-binding domain-containing protein n=1 Tax=Acanthopleuribacter pedis TaxID=442870 RepID=A0A8J7Q3L1_9BACT|nr:transporter substrate-binding domain-containing protein [Acanthopleuribacter pedis]MBO1317011.1 transporter substrate-binding domain-containing protein [Acanthopleuribacter pedis]
MYRLFVSAFLIWFSFASATAQTARVRITTGDWPPYNGKSLPGGGIANALIQAAFCEVGIEIEFGYFPWSRSLKLAVEGDWDASAIWAHTTDRQEHLLYSEVIVDGEDVFYYIRGTPFDWAHLDDLKGWKVGGTIGYSYTALSDEKGVPVVDLERAPSDLLNFRKLLAGRIQVFVADRRVGAYLLNHHFTQEERDRIVRHPRAIQTVPYYLVFSKKASNAAYLHHAFNQGLASLREHQDQETFIELIERASHGTPKR